MSADSRSPLDCRSGATRVETLPFAREGGDGEEGEVGFEGELSCFTFPFISGSGDITVVA